MWLLRVLLRNGSITPDEYGLLDGPSDALGFPVNYREIVQFYGLTYGVAVLIDEREGS